MLAFDSGLPLRPEGLAKEERCSLLTPACLASDSGPSLQPEGLAKEERRSLSKNPKNQAEQVRQGSQVNRNTEDHNLHTYRIVLSGHVRRVLCNLLDVSEHEQCCGR